MQLIHSLKSLSHRDLIYILILIAISFFPLLKVENFLYGNEVLVDCWKYFGLNYQTYQIEGNYMDDRVPVLFFNSLLHRLFDLDTALNIKYFFSLFTLWFVTYNIFNKLFNSNIAKIIVLLTAINPLVYGLLSIEYPSIGVDIYVYSSFYFFIQAKEKNSNKLLILASFLFCSGILSNIRAIVYYVWIPFYYLFKDKIYKKTFLSFVSCNFVGLSLSFLFWGVLNYFVNDNFWVFKDQFMHIFIIDEGSYSPGLLYRLKNNAIPHFISYFIAISLFLKFKYDCKDYSYIQKFNLMYISIIAILILISFNYFVTTSIHWPFLLFNLLFALLLSSLNININKIVIYFILSVVIVISFITDIRIMSGLYDIVSYWYIPLVIFSIFSLLLFTHKKKTLNWFIVVVIFMQVSILRPYHYGDFPFKNNSDSAALKYEYNTIKDIIIDLDKLNLKRRIVFTEDENTTPFFEKLRIAVSGGFPDSNLKLDNIEFKWVISKNRIIATKHSLDHLNNVVAIRQLLNEKKLKIKLLKVYTQDYANISFNLFEIVPK